MLLATGPAQERLDRLLKSVVPQTRWAYLEVLANHEHPHFVHLAIKKLIDLIENIKTRIE